MSYSEILQDSEDEMEMEMKAVCMAPVISGGVWKAFQNFRAN